MAVRTNLKTARGAGYTASATSEKYAVMQPIGQPSKRRAVIYCHPSGSDHTIAFDHNYYAKVAEALAAAGYLVMVPDLGTAAQPAWNNDHSQQALTDAISFIDTNYLAAVDKVHLMGTSMGGGTSLIWAANNPSRVASVSTFIGAIDLEYVHDRPGGDPSVINTAYGSEAAYLAAEPTHNAVKRTADLQGLPIKLWYSTDDVFTPASIVTDFASAVSAETVNLGAVGHSAQSVDLDELVAWVSSNESA